MTWWVVVDEVIRGEIEVIGVLKGEGEGEIDVIMRGWIEEGCQVTCRGADV
jgi:hypothetical protein